MINADEIKQQPYSRPNANPTLATTVVAKRDGRLCLYSCRVDPEELARREKRLPKLAAARAKIEAPAKETG